MTMIQRTHIGIFGKVNAGKSSLMNLITQAETSLVDPTPGTTADSKVALMEIHGLGPVKIYDTPGLDEAGVLGEKKRSKALSELKECDLILLVIDPSDTDCGTEKELIEKARAVDKQILIIENIFKEKTGKKTESKLYEHFSELKFYKKLQIEANQSAHRQHLLDFIIVNYESKNTEVDLLPFLQKDEYYILNIPMDSETPPGRLLRPQAMVEEYITRHWAYAVTYRMDLKKARDPKEIEEEKRRFDLFISNFKKKPKAIITDSQAMDVMHSWVPHDIMLTTFSIVMINFQSKGRLRLFVEGIKALSDFKPGDKVMISEACNHSRIGEDIGTVQIPNYIKKKYPGVTVEHKFGREFYEIKNMDEYKLIIQCGGCMISPQAISARIRDMAVTGVPFTNYGLFLSYMQGSDALKKVLQPWGLSDLINKL